MSDAQELLLRLSEMDQTVTPRRRVRNLAKLTINQMMQSTQAMRAQQNPVGRVEYVGSKPLIRNRQIIFKFETRAKTPGVSKYRQTIIFHKVAFSDVRTADTPLEIKLEGGSSVFAQMPEIRTHPVSVICSCADFRFTWSWWLNRDKALVGSRPKPYTRKTPPPPIGYPYRNPEELPGICKHIIACFAYLRRNKVIR